MVKFILNGQSKYINEEENLLRFLKEKERIISVKNGCNEGACGTCTVLIDGKATKSCLIRGKNLDNKSVITIEGLEQRVKSVFEYTFKNSGAVQCGFCIPGMIICAVSLFNKTLKPSHLDVKNALKGNICRCTGYVKIEEAILLAATMLRHNIQVPEMSGLGRVGESLERLDATEKILGYGEYVGDCFVENMAYGVALKSKYPRAIVKSIDYSKAEKLDGVVKVITWNDIPGERYGGHIKKDWPALVAVGEETRYVGDNIALVVAESEEIARRAMDNIEIDYEELQPISSPKDALVESAPHIHESGNILAKELLKRGNTEEVIKKSKYVVTNKYSVPFTEHAFLEPESALAIPENDGILVYTGDQSIYDDLREISELLGIDKSKVRIIAKNVGGGFGGKEDMSVQHIAALMCYLTKRPVKVTYSREDSMKSHPKRHAMEMEFTLACDANGKFTAMKGKIISDTGAYASLGGPVLQRACTHAAGPYNYQNVDIEGIAVYTNNPPGGAFRGFGVTQSAFANEANINMLAKLIGLSPWEIRYRNAIECGQELPNGQIADEGTAFKETLLAVKDEYYNNKNVGISCAMKNSGIGVGLPDVGRCVLEIRNKKILIKTSAACIGQGIATILTQIVCETLGIASQSVEYIKPDTSKTPNTGTTTASRQTLFTGEATRSAALKIKDDLNDKTIEEIEGKEYYGEFSAITDRMGTAKNNPVSHVAYGYATQVVILNDEGKVIKVVAAHDVGRAINPKMVEGQIEGGVVMGLGYALTEEYVIKNSVPISKFGTLGLFRSTMIPEIETIIIEKCKSKIAYGAKGIGEITCIPTAPAVQGAYYNFDGVFRTKLPLETTYYRKRKKFI